MILSLIRAAFKEKHDAPAVKKARERERTVKLVNSVLKTVKRLKEERAKLTTLTEIDSWKARVKGGGIELMEESERQKYLQQNTKGGSDKFKTRLVVENTAILSTLDMNLHLAHQNDTSLLIVSRSIMSHLPTLYDDSKIKSAVKSRFDKIRQRVYNTYTAQINKFSDEFRESLLKTNLTAQLDDGSPISIVDAAVRVVLERTPALGELWSAQFHSASSVPKGYPGFNLLTAWQKKNGRVFPKKKRGKGRKRKLRDIEERKEDGKAKKDGDNEQVEILRVSLVQGALETIKRNRNNRMIKLENEARIKEFVSEPGKSGKREKKGEGAGMGLGEEKEAVEVKKGDNGEGETGNKGGPQKAEGQKTSEEQKVAIEEKEKALGTEKCYFNVDGASVGWGRVVGRQTSFYPKLPEVDRKLTEAKLLVYVEKVLSLLSFLSILSFLLLLFVCMYIGLRELAHQGLGAAFSAGNGPPS